MNNKIISNTSKLGIGLDYGTSNSATALFDGDQVILVKLEGDTVIMPSATYIDRELKISTGQQAINDYITANTGRKVELSAELLGEGRATTGQIGDQGLPEEATTQKFYGQSIVDAGEKGRLFRGVKRLLGNSSILRLMVFDRPFRLVALVTPLVLRIRKALESYLVDHSTEDHHVNHGCIGHPVNFEGSDATHNTTAIERLSEACHHAGFKDQLFYPEPIAAAVSYLYYNPEASGRSLLAVDFGGGTLDLCVLQRKGAEFSVVATHGIALGGDHIDQRLFKELLFPLLGKGERWRRKGEDREIETVFPFEEYEDFLLNWAISYMLNQNQYTTPVMQRIEQNDHASDKFRRLYELIKRNYSYLVFQCIKDFKAELSMAEQARLDIPELDIDLTLTRVEFESIIGDQLQTFEKAVTDVLEMAGYDPEEVDLVIRTGGSSLIPAVRNILEDLFSGKVIEHDPFTSVAAGLAIAEYKNLASSRPWQNQAELPGS